MPALHRHLPQAERNERAADDMASLPERHPDWEVTMLFYSALHYADAFLATIGMHPQNHGERHELLSILTDAAEYYLVLYKRSMNARYHIYQFTPPEVDRIRNGAFRRVKGEMLALLANGT